MARRRTRVLALLGAAVVFAVFIAILAKNASYLRQTVELDARVLVALVLLTVGVFAVRAMMNLAMFSPLGVKAPFHYWFGLVVVGALANALPFVAGAAAKGYLLKRLHKLPYTTFAGGQVTLFALVICTNGVIGLLLLVLYFRAEAQPIVWVLFLLMACACLVFFLPRLTRNLLGSKRFHWPEWSGRDRTRAWLGGAVCQVVILNLLAAKLYLCFSLGLETVTFSACLLFSASVAITRLASLTPGSIGFREFLIGALAYLTGFEFRDALIASTIDRVVELLVVGVLAPVMSAYFDRMIQRTGKDSPEEQAVTKM